MVTLAVDRKIPFKFDNLESFSICYPIDLVNEHFYNFIDKHSTIKTLKIRYCSFDLSDALISKLEESLPSLTELEFEKYNLSIDEVIISIEKFDSLKVFRFTWLCHGTIEDLQDRLGNDWMVTQTVRD